MENIIDLATDTKSINLSNKKLTELPDLSSFTQLETLVCDNNRLTSLPNNLPNSIKTLWCYNNRLASLPEKLPDSLENFWCHNNLISSIPSHKDYFPKLKDLCISNNKLTHFPDNVFNSSLLENISICDNQIAYLQHDVDIHSLKCFKKLFCAHNKLTCLPNWISESPLEDICCDNNHITELPPLPPSLLQLHCNNNLLTSLPRLPNDLFCLWCSNNPIRYLPKLPDALGSLHCYSTKITEYPVLPRRIYECYSDLHEGNYIDSTKIWNNI